MTHELATVPPSEGQASRWSWRAATGHLDLVALGVLLAGVALLLPHGMPAGVLVAGVVTGCVFSLQALGLVMVMRNDRIINFAQVQLGVLSATLFSQFVIHSTGIRLLRDLCGPCVPGLPRPNAFYSTHPKTFLADLQSHGLTSLLVANFAVSALIALVVAPLIAVAVYLLIVRRFATSSRLVLTVATIGIGQLVAGLGVRLTGGWFSGDVERANFVLPFSDPTFHVGLQVFRTGDVVAVVLAVLVFVGLGIFLRSRRGIALRGAAEDSERAETLGINVASIGSMAWMFAGALSACAAIVETMRNAGTGQGASGAFDTTTLVTILVILVFARQTNIWLVVPVAAVMGVLQQTLLWNQRSTAPFLVLLLPMVLVAFMLQGRRKGRSDREEAAHLAAREARPIPQALRALRPVRRNTRLLLAALIVTVLVYPLAMSPGQVVLGTGFLLRAIIALSILVLTGWAGQISLGQMGFAAVGAWTAAVLAGQYHLPFLLCLLGGSVAGAIVAVIVGLPALRLRGLNLAVVTLCFSVSIISILFTSDYLGGALPDRLDRPFLLGINLDSEPTYYYFALIMLLLVTVSVVGMRRSKFARVLIAARDNEGAAQSLGVSLLRTRLEAFAISGFLAAFAGGIIAFHQGNAIAFTYGADQSIQLFLMTVIGGLGAIIGPLLGAAYLGLFAILADPTISVLATGGGLVAMLILAPGGLASIVYRVRDLMFRRIALRRRIVVPGLVEEAELTAGVVRAPIVPKTVAGAQQYLPERYRRDDNWRRLRGVG